MTPQHFGERQFVRIDIRRKTVSGVNTVTLVRIPTPPQNGIHTWIPSAAHYLKRAGVSPSEAIQVLLELEPYLRRTYQPGELQRAVALVFDASINEGIRGAVRKASRSAFNLASLERIASQYPGVNEPWLINRSPVPVVSVSPGDFLRAISRTGERLLCFRHFKSQGEHLWHNTGGVCPDDSELLFWRTGLEDGAWFLPQPVSGEFAEIRDLRRQNGVRKTRRSAVNVTFFRFAVLESDEAPADLWMSFLAQLPLPIVSITTSGGRSIHALVRVDAPTKA